MPKKKKMSRIARINATLDRFARLIEANARQLRKDKAENRRQRAKDRAEWKSRFAEWERQRALDKAEAKAEAKARAEAEAAEAKRKKAEAEAEAKRKKAEAEAEAKRRAENEKSLQEMKASISNLGRHVWGMGISIGDITETITLSDKIIEQVKAIANIDIKAFDGNRERSYKIDPDGKLEGKNKKQFEIDGLIVGKTAVMVLEAKTKLNKGDIIDFLKGLPTFREVFTEYANHNVYAGVAFIRANDKTLAYAEQKGLFIIKAEPPNVMLVNSKGFKPTKFFA